MVSPEKVLLTITIDTECDHDKAWAKSDPLTFDSICEGIPNRLQPIFNDIGAIPTYLLTVEVLEDANSVRALSALSGTHELGTHLHAGFIAPEKKYTNYAGVDGREYQREYPAEVELAKLRNLTDLFELQFGYRPTSFRAGRFGAGSHTIAALSELGYKVDTSVVPHKRFGEDRACNIDYRKAPEQPYFPAKHSLVQLGNSPVLELPVTMYKRPLHSAKWFRPWRSTVDQMKSIVHYYLKRYASKNFITLNMMFHSMEVIPGASPYPQTDEEVNRFIDDLCNILQWCKKQGIDFSSASQIASLVASSSRCLS